MWRRLAIVICVALCPAAAFAAPQPPGRSAATSQGDAQLLDDNSDSIAIIVGNRNYRQTTPVDYAHNDADAMRDYLVRGLRFRESNVFVLRDATLNELNQAFGSDANPQAGRLWRSVVAGRSNVFVYYSGHGAPNLQTRQPFLLPHDGDPNFSESGYPLETLYRNLELVKLKVGDSRQVIVMVDACFTGETGRKGQGILSVSAPGFTPARPRAATGVIRLAATSGVSPANWDDANRLGLFTSRFLMAAAGLASMGDDDDRRISWDDLRAYVTREVEATARREVGREQEPEIDLAALSLPRAEPPPAIRDGFARARDEQMWREAEQSGTRAALERYVALCSQPCAYQRRAMDLLLDRKRGAAAQQDDENWKKLGAEGKYQQYLDTCGQVCAYRPLALGYLGKDVNQPSTPPAPDTSARPDEGAPPVASAVTPDGNVSDARARAFEQAKRTGTVASYDRFLRAYPKGADADAARSARALIVKRNAANKPYEPTAAEIRSLRPTAAERARYTPSQAQIDAMAERYRPQYMQIMQRQGKAAADVWINKKGREMGRQMSHAASRRILIDRHRAANRGQ